MKKIVTKAAFLTILLTGIALIILNLLKICPEPNVPANLKECLTQILVIMIAFGPLTGTAMLVFGLAGLLID